MAQPKKTCRKCGKIKPETEFFKTRAGTKHDMCKKCLTQHIDNEDPQTFLWILEEFDIPYIEQRWKDMAAKIYEKNKTSFGPASVIGQYIRTMNLGQYKNYTYKDTDYLNNPEGVQQPKHQDNSEYEQELRERLEKGEISQAQYETMSPTTYVENFDKNEFIGEMEIIENPPVVGAKYGKLDLGFDPNYTPQFAQEPQQQITWADAVDEQKILGELEESEVLYLANKWGNTYKPSEWLQMEDMYNRYTSDFEITVDREVRLIKMCKTSLKMDQALDEGDVGAFQKLNGVFDTLSKAGKFTDAQNKEEQVREYDSIGELVALCERLGGKIDVWPVDPDEFPQDKVDLSIKDTKGYIFHLVKEELNLGDLIETYMEKLDKANQSTIDDQNLADQIITSTDELLENSVSMEDYLNYSDQLEAMVEQDAAFMLGEE